MVNQTEVQEKAVARVLYAIDAIKKAGMVIMVDEEDRENEGDFVCAAEHVTPELINIMAREGCGLICVALESSFVERLRLPMMLDQSKAGCERGTAFTVSIEARRGVTTGISAKDRAHTIRVAVDERSTPDDIVVPGHIFPLRAKDGGVLERAGHTEGSVDLAKLAGLKGAAVICEIMNADGSMARLPDLERLAAKMEIPIVKITDLIMFRLMRDTLVEMEAKRVVSTARGDFDGYVFKSKLDGARHFALVRGDDFKNKVVDVRVHVQRALADVFGTSGGARLRLEQGLSVLEKNEAAVLVYLTRPSPHTSFVKELEEMTVGGKVQEETSEGEDAPRIGAQISMMDDRAIGIGSQILRALGVEKMRVHATSVKPYVGLAGFGLHIEEHVVMDEGKKS